uniref:Uncharacterized protein n=1 Tax=Clastoptera arizonana TaxID=38151 RepID=A0A1B6D6T7_9HEMI
MFNLRHLRFKLKHICTYRTQTQINHKKLKQLQINKGKFNKNPGIENQLKIFANNEPDIESMNLEDIDPEKLEADFMKAGDIVDHFDRTVAKTDSRHKFKSIEQKYFKSDPNPNMLTWAEKEQIRHLHEENPTIWTPDKLSASFPALPEVIKKVLKSSWKPQSADRIINHDKSVSQNWINLGKGQLEINDPELKAHLKKFFSRLNQISSYSESELKQITEPIRTKPKNSEFSLIISSYKPNSLKEKCLPIVVDCTKEIKTTEVSNKKINKNKHHSLESFKNEVEKEINKSEIVTKENLSLLTDKKRNLTSHQYVPPSERFDCDAIVQRKGKTQHLALSNKETFPNKIFIPKNKRKPGTLYKVNDCYYTSDGLFLYRVPGITMEV